VLSPEFAAFDAALTREDVAASTRRAYLGDLERFAPPPSTSASRQVKWGNTGRINVASKRATGGRL
jgi:hypothetical protein